MGFCYHDNSEIHSISLSSDTGVKMRPQRKSYVYTAFTKNYKYSTVVYAQSMKQARMYGFRDTLGVMGKCAVIRRDIVEEMK